jgi:benzoyl-CoA reductase/2-hydroxyglutaryl-CoA dehydratase subunit BcrC/BadD/HgdB
MQVFVTSPWVPAEWIKAHGLEPRGVWFAEGFGCRTQPLAAGVCAFANGVVRLAEERPDSAVVFTTHCDQLRRGFDTLAGKLFRRVFLFNLPATWRTPVAERLFCAEMERLGQFLLELGGHSPSSDELRRIVAQYAAGRRTLLGSAQSCAARQYAEAVARFHWDGAGTGCPQSTDATPGATGTGRTGSAIPLALVGGPLPREQWSLLETIANAGGCVVLNATDAGERSLWDAPSDSAADSDGARKVAASQEGCAAPGVRPMVALAREYLGHCVDVFQRPNTRLYDWLRERLAARKVRGIVLWHYVGCDLWRAEAQSLREAFGLPVLALEAWESASVPLRNQGRIEAFLEGLK